MQKTFQKEGRRLVITIVPREVIKKNLYEDVFKQILDSVLKFKCFEFDKGDADLHEIKGVHQLILKEKNNKKKVFAIVEKFNFKIIS